MNAKYSGLVKEIINLWSWI